MYNNELKFLCTHFSGWVETEIEFYFPEFRSFSYTLENAIIKLKFKYIQVLVKDARKML